MLKKIFSIIFITTWVLSIQAQDKDETPVVSPVVKNSAKTDKLDVSVSAGTSFMYSKNYGNGMSTYVSPELTYKLTPRLHLNVGIMFLNSNYLVNRYQALSNEQSVVVKTRPTTSTLAFVSGDYLVSDRLTISGMLMRDLSAPQGYGKNSYPSIQAMSLQMDYKLTDHISIGAGMHMTQGNYWGYPGTGYGLYPTTNFNPMFNY